MIAGPFSTYRRRSWTSRTRRANWSCSISDLEPGLAYRAGETAGDSRRLRPDLVRADRNHDAVHASAISVRADRWTAVAGQSRAGVRAGRRTHRCKSRRRIRIPASDRAFSASIAARARGTRSSGTSRFRRRSDSDLNFEIGYLGSKNTRLGVPDANLNQLPAADLRRGAALLARVSNPYFGRDSQRRRPWARRPSRHSSCSGRFRDSLPSRSSATISATRITTRSRRSWRSAFPAA